MVQRNIQQAQYRKGQDWILAQKWCRQKGRNLQASKAQKSHWLIYRGNELIITDRCFGIRFKEEMLSLGLRSKPFQTTAYSVGQDVIRSPASDLDWFDMVDIFHIPASRCCCGIIKSDNNLWHKLKAYTGTQTANYFGVKCGWLVGEKIGIKTKITLINTVLLMNYALEIGAHKLLGTMKILHLQVSFLSDYCSGISTYSCKAVQCLWAQLPLRISLWSMKTLMGCFG